MNARNYLLAGTMLLAVALTPNHGTTAHDKSGPTSSVGRPVSPLCRSRSDCGTTLLGGLQLESTGWACTSGFVARSTTTQQRYVVTAGHCLADSGLYALWTHHRRTVGRAAMTAFRVGSSADAGAVELPLGSGGNGVFGSGPADILAITGRAPDATQTVGARVCRSAATSGWRCGSVTRADVATSIRGLSIKHTWWIDFPSSTGDSGSPVLDTDGRIAGIVIATTSTESVYSTVDAIGQELGVRPCFDEACS